MLSLSSSLFGFIVLLLAHFNLQNSFVIIETFVGVDESDFWFQQKYGTQNWCVLRAACLSLCCFPICVSEDSSAGFHAEDLYRLLERKLLCSLFLLSKTKLLQLFSYSSKAKEIYSSTLARLKVCIQVFLDTQDV